MSVVELFFARHGDTFAPGQPVVWAGSKNDLPLAPRGIEQARILGEALKRCEIAPTRVLTGPLERTREFARLALEASGSRAIPQIDPRLDEIDYGLWSGLTNRDIIERYGSRELELWNALSIWPKEANWGSSETVVRGELHTLIQEVVTRGESPVLLISSNGRLRYVLTMIARELERRVRDQTFKMKTGNLSCLRWDGSDFSLPFWDIPPSDLNPARSS
jgi:probable phosphoglycerate mutase